MVRPKAQSLAAGQGRALVIATKQKNHGEIDVGISQAGLRCKDAPVEGFGFREFALPMVLQCLTQGRFGNGRLKLLHGLIRLPAASMSSSEEEGEVDASVFITGLEADDVGFMEEIGVENHRPVGAIGTGHRP